MIFNRPIARLPEALSPQPLSFLDSIIFYCIVSLLLAAPLAFGAVEPWAIFLLELTSASLFVVWICRQAISARCVIRWNSLFAPMFAFLFLIILQLLLKTSAYRHATISTVELYCAYGLLCFLVVQSFRSTSQAIVLARIVSAYGLLVAGWSLIQGMSSNGKIYWLRVPRSGGWIYGPYINHNHYAGFIEMLFPVPLVFSMTDHARGGKRTLAVLAAAVMATTIFLSGSRGGMAAFVLEMIVFLVVLLDRRKSPIPRRRGRSFAIFSAILLGLLFWIGGDALRSRLVPSRGDFAEEMRPQINRDLIRAVHRRPLLGWGLGTFGEIYPQFRSFPTTNNIDEAHNDYLQLLMETGGVGFIIALWFLAVALSRAWQKARGWASDPNGAIALAALLGITGILAHSFVDFNLEVPANAAIFYVLCAIAAMPTNSSRT